MRQQFASKSKSAVDVRVSETLLRGNYLKKQRYFVTKTLNEPALFVYLAKNTPNEPKTT